MRVVELDEGMRTDLFFYDLLSELRKDPQRREAVDEALKRVDRVTHAFQQGKASRSEITKAEADLVPLCGYNFGLLMPRMFPRYPLDAPLDFSSRPFMFAMTGQGPGSIVTLKAGRQVGKCADGATELRTPEGNTTMEELFDEGLPILRS